MGGRDTQSVYTTHRAGTARFRGNPILEMSAKTGAGLINPIIPEKQLTTVDSRFLFGCNIDVARRHVKGGGGESGSGGGWVGWG